MGLFISKHDDKTHSHVSICDITTVKENSKEQHKIMVLRLDLSVTDHNAPTCASCFYFLQVVKLSEML